MNDHEPAPAHQPLVSAASSDPTSVTMAGPAARGTVRRWLSTRRARWIVIAAAAGMLGAVVEASLGLGGSFPARDDERNDHHSGDRVVKLSDGVYEVHNIGINWPHHVFIDGSFKVFGAN
jgi:hypothetical protein